MDHKEVRVYVGKINLVYERALCRNVVYTIRNHARVVIMKDFC
jgi:hypothetical protein